MKPAPDLADVHPASPHSMEYTRSPLFGLVAPVLGWVPPIRYLLRRRRVLRVLRRLPAGRLLEIGCGAGALLDELAAIGHAATGLETSPSALAVAQRLGEATGGNQVLVATPQTGWQGHFDLLCALDVLEHIEEDGKALDEWLTYLKPGGLLCLTVPAHRSRWSAGDEWAGHYRRYDRVDLLSLFNSRQLSILHFECYGFPLANLTEWWGVRTYRRLLKERGDSTSSAQASAQSGVDRREYQKLFGRMNSMVGRLALRANFVLQAMTSRLDLGSGYLVLARAAPTPREGVAS
ncbi:MAG: methyltransferase domain-containing protein [Pseudomarimonas sp.]